MAHQRFPAEHPPSCKTSFPAVTRNGGLADWVPGRVARHRTRRDRKVQERFVDVVLPEVEVLMRVALSLTGSTSDAEDLVQETMLRAFRAPLCGNGGNHVPVEAAPPSAGAEDVLALVDEARSSLSRPPLDDLRAAAVKEWVELVNSRLLFREDRRRLAREAMRVLDDALRADIAADRLSKQGERQEAVHWVKEAGTSGGVQGLGTQPGPFAR